MANHYQWPIAVAIAYAVFAAPIPQGEAIASTYGGGEQALTGEQIQTALYLAFPQTYSSMRFLGVPKWRDAQSDWYPLPYGGYLRIDYDRHGRAIDLAFEGGF